MMDAVWRMAWALPLVLAVGIAAALILKPFVAPGRPAAGRMRRMSMRESLSLSDETRVHLIEVDGKGYLIVESVRQTVLQAALHTGEASLVARFGRSWVQRRYRDRPV